MSTSIEGDSGAGPSSSKPPPSKKPAHQPKSGRQQFSACGACRMRRVRCDLKDRVDSSSCSNCLEHGFNCVDEFRTKGKTGAGGKLLRRGPRIQQVEAVYGPVAAGMQSPPPPQTVIPRLDPRFLDSRFYARFHIQRPILEPVEFKARYTAFFNGDGEALGVPGQLLAMLLVIWAASYGVDHFGEVESSHGPQEVQRRRERTNEMVKELLQLIDIHGLPRKPSWDGVRVLLLIMPLTEDVADPLERLTMYETAINQVYTLCSIASPRSVNSGQGDQVDAMVRARIYWYAYVHEGVTTGLRGGRLHLADDDLVAFQAIQESAGALTPSQLNISLSRRWAMAPLRLASACRQINRTLTGPKARERQNIDEKGLKDAWEAIENSWEEFESLRQLGLLGILTVEEANRFVDGWKIFIFEAHNVIREFLKQRLLAVSGDSPEASITDPERRRETYSTLFRLHAIAEAKCQDVVQHVVSMVRRHVGSSFFEYDASMVRDGCFFAGYMLATDEGIEGECETCLKALSEMRWAFSKSEERIQTLKLIWDMRRASIQNQSSRVQHLHSPSHPHGPTPPPTAPHVPYKVESDAGTWSTEAQGPALAAPSPEGPAHVIEDRIPRYSSVSDRSTISGGSPYTPASMPSNAPYASHRTEPEDALSRPPRDMQTGGMGQHGQFYYSSAALPNMDQPAPDGQQYYSYDSLGPSSSMGSSHFHSVSAPTTYVGSDGQLYISSAPRLISNMGQDYRNYPTLYTYSS